MHFYENIKYYLAGNCKIFNLSLPEFVLNTACDTYSLQHSEPDIQMHYLKAQITMHGHQEKATFWLIL